MFKLKIRLLILLLTHSALAYSQTYNQKNTKGKKHGDWIEYINFKFHVVDSSKKAIFKRIVRYDNGVAINNVSLSNFFTKGQFYRNDTLVKYQGLQPIWLEGKFTDISKNGDTLQVFYFMNGRIVGEHKNYDWGVMCKSCPAKNLLHEYINYDNKYNNEDYTFYYEEYDKNGIKKFSGYWRKGEIGWAIYEE